MSFCFTDDFKSCLLTSHLVGPQAQHLPPDAGRSLAAWEAGEVEANAHTDTGPDGGRHGGRKEVDDGEHASGDETDGDDLADVEADAWDAVGREGDDGTLNEITDDSGEDFVKVNPVRCSSTVHESFLNALEKFKLRGVFKHGRMPLHFFLV